MAKLTAEEFATKQATRLKAATQDMADGVNKVTENPAKKAADKADKWLAGIQRAHQNKKFQKGLGRVTLDGWKKDMIEKGVPRVAQGIDAAHDKVVDFANQLLPFQDNLKQTISKMPDVTLEDSISRMTSWVRGMSKFQRK
jgi:hypothetical protein